jgi:hypothetical protein
MDVVNFLRRKVYDFSDTFQVVVLHGSVKAEQAERYSAALERFGVKVVRMKPIASIVGADRHYFKPTWYMHRMMGTEIPVGSDIMLIGFHNPRYRAFLQRYSPEYTLSMAAFTTPSRRTGWMGIPEDFSPYLKSSLNLDDFVEEIKAEFKRKAG